VKKAYKAQAE